jgi:penicillin-binding protein 1A
MFDKIKSLLQHPVVLRTRQVVGQATTTLGYYYNLAMAPLRRLFAPVTNWWLDKTAPIRARWAAFNEKNPGTGWTLGWIGTFMKWGFYTLLAIIFMVWIGLFGSMPSRDDLRNIETSNATEVLTADSVIIGKYYIENRTAIGLDKISPYIVTALLATEDKRFFEHSGIDLMSWLRAFKGVATNAEGTGGGSTLSQQLAKNLYPRKRYWVPGLGLLVSKIRENIISIRLESVYDKEQILNLYLNTVPFGGDRFGINVASKYFYNKKAKDLTPDQAATLIGMLKATTALDPTRNPEDSKNRRDLVLRRMVRNQNFELDGTEFPTVAKMIKDGRLGEKECEELLKKPLGAKKYGGDGNNDGSGTYFREYLRTKVMPRILEDLKKEDGTPYNLYRDGLRIHTTLNSRMQEHAEAAVREKMGPLQAKFNQHWKNAKEKPWGDDKWILEQIQKSDRYEALKTAGKSEADILKNFEEPVKMTIFSWKGGGGEADTTMTPIDSVRYYFCMLNCGFMAMEHKTGYVRAWVGGTNFRYFKYDHIISERHVGSTFKPIVYSAALQDSVKPCQYFRNDLTTIEDWTPHNADESYGGWYSLIGGLTNSVNVIAAKLIDKVGIQNTLDLAAKMGVTSKLPREFGISLGACDIKLYDMMKVYGTIANKGVRPEPVLVLKVTDRSGKVIYDYKKELAANKNLGPHVQAMTADQAATMTRMMQSVIDYGTGRRMRTGFGLTADFAGKTGTTQEQSDGWFMTFNPTLVTGAWVGGPSPAVRFRSLEMGQGSSTALPIVASFWHKLGNDSKHRSLLYEKFEISPEIQSRCGCPFRISISPDTLNMLLQDSTIRDSLRANGYKNLKQIAQERFGQPIPDDPGGAGEVDPDKFNDQVDNAPKKDSKDKKQEPEDKKRTPREALNDLFNRDKNKDKDKKTSGGNN